MKPYVSCEAMLMPTAYAVWTSVKEKYWTGRKHTEDLRAV